MLDFIAGYLFQSLYLVFTAAIEENFTNCKFLASNFRNSLRFYCRFTGPTIPKVRGFREKNL